ncbi:major facilitator superfamily domain-containing protein [Entophlyctis helioformis]|nr:major facilitator superfamily domain-containing protein [Entophlyctis helioformis]
MAKSKDSRIAKVLAAAQARLRGRSSPSPSSAGTFAAVATADAAAATSGSSSVSGPATRPRAPAEPRTHGPSPSKPATAAAAVVAAFQPSESAPSHKPASAATANPAVPQGSNHNNDQPSDDEGDDDDDDERRPLAGSIPPSSQTHAGAQYGALATTSGDDGNGSDVTDSLAPTDPFALLSDTISFIGMGSFQWKLFWLCGMGWVADNMWLQAIAAVLPQIQREFGLPDSLAGLGTTCAFMGMIVGSAGWGLLSDVIGRRPAFHWTLLIAGTCGTLAAFAPTYTLLCLAYAGMAFGVGGNLPVDGTLFLEFTPAEYQRLLTLLSVFWPVGQVIVSLVAWAVVPPFSCPSTGVCDTTKNYGWRILLLIMGLITLLMVVGRIALFRMYESPKYLLATGQREKAVKVLHKLAHMNGKVLQLVPEDFPLPDEIAAEQRQGGFQLDHLRALFAKDMRLTTSLVWAIWMLIALGYVMFNGFLTKFLMLHGGSQDRPPLSDSETYRNYAVISFFGVPGSLLATYMVETQLGRIWTMALSTLGTACALSLFTVFTSSVGQVVVSGIASLLQNIMYGVLYSYSPEVFRTEFRGTAVGIASALGRITGTIAPILTGVLMEHDLSLPMYVASVMLGLAFVCMVMLPIETRGRRAM